MRRAEGTCIHCSEYVVRDESGVLVSTSAGGPDLTQCGAIEGSDHQLDDETYVMVDEGTIDGVQYVTVLDGGGNPQEYNITRADALARYFDED